MLSAGEKKGAKKLLDMLSTTELMSMADTVTQKLIKVNGREEAINAILTCTEKPLDLLKRKKIKKEILFSFLIENNVTISPSSDKRQVILAVLKFWGSDIDSLESMELDFESYEMDRSHVKCANSGVQANFTTSESGVQVQASDNTVSQNQNAVLHVQETRLASVDRPPDPVIDLTSEPAHHGQSEQRSELHILGEKFVDWFYNMLNSHNPCCSSEPQDFGPHHFWDEVKLSIQSPPANEEVYCGPGVVAQRLLAFPKEEQIMFNPNVCSEGVFTKASCHGLVLIVVCGTIHRRNECLGVFQQVFGIIKDPRYSNNWKIKISKLMAKCELVSSLPRLTGNIDAELDALVPVH